MATHQIYLPDLTQRLANPAGGDTLSIDGDEAHHAIRVKRLETGDFVRVCDGRGTVVDGTITNTRKEKRSGDWVIDLGSLKHYTARPTEPFLRVLTGVPKGDGLDTIVDGLSQVGAGAWGPLESRRSVVDPRENKLNRLARVAQEALKQCGRSHLLELLPSTPLAAALRSPGPIIVADASGQRYQPINSKNLTLLIGPEGGWDPAEMEAFEKAGAIIANFGIHVMRIEVAAVVAAGVVMGG